MNNKKTLSIILTVSLIIGFVVYFFKTPNSKKLEQQEVASTNSQNIEKEENNYPSNKMTNDDIQKKMQEAFAKHPIMRSDYYKKIQQRSKEVGFSTDTIKVKKRVKKNNFNELQKGLAKLFNGKNKKLKIPFDISMPIEQLKLVDGMNVFEDRLVYYKNGIDLEIGLEGNFVLFRDTNLSDSPTKTGTVSLSDSQSIGVNFINNNLLTDGVINIGSSETIEYMGKRDVVDAMGDIEAGTVETQTMANTANFIRTIDGQPVVGPGSQLNVTFTSDGEVIGFEADWSTFEDPSSNNSSADNNNSNGENFNTQSDTPSTGNINEQQDVVTINEIEDRLIEQTQQNLQDNPNIEEFLCGYIDGGHEYPNDTLQAGCLVKYKIFNESGTIQAMEVFVPAGQNFVEDQFTQSVNRPPSASDRPSSSN